MTILKTQAALFAAAALLPGAAAAQIANADAARFGALEMAHGVILAPDGQHIAYINSGAAGDQVIVADPATGKIVPVMNLARKIGRIQWCAWPAAMRLVCQSYHIINDGTLLVSATRLFAVNADASGLTSLSARTDSRSRGYYQDGGSIIAFDVAEQPGAVLMTKQFLANDTTGSHIGSSKSGLGVERVDTVSLKRNTVEGPRATAADYIADGKGNVRIMSLVPERDGVMGNKRVYMYRQAGKTSWDSLSEVIDGNGFRPVAVDAAKNVAYGFDRSNGYQALFSKSLDGQGTVAKLVGMDGIEVDQLITVGRQQRVVGASYATDRRMIEYFDPQLRALGTALGKALKGSPQVDVIDATADESKLLVVASSDTQPGDFYLYDKATKQLAELVAARPQLAKMTLSPMRAVTYKAADGTQVPAYLTVPAGAAAKGLPAIVLPHGGPSARDEWGFDWLAQYYAARGFAVLQPNYRGSSGYGSDWYQKNGFKSWQTAIGDVNDAGRWLVSEGIAAPDKLAIVGWSYGGYAALQSAVLDNKLFKAIVAIAPVTDLDMVKREAEEFTNRDLVAAFVGTGPHVAAGSPARNAAAITAPVMLFHGTQDINVGVEESRLMARRLKEAGKKVTYVEFDGLDHQLADPAARTRMLSESDAFLRTALALPAK